MILFGHVGLTLAITRTADAAVIKRKIDYRFVLLGSVLPDIIDKTILFITANETFRSGRAYAHTFLFSLLLFTLGLAAWYGFKKSWVLILAVCCFIHQILDAMWNKLNIFLWPVYNSPSPSNNKSVQTWVPLIPDDPKAGQIELTWHTAKKLLFNPYTGIPEILGVLIILYFIFKLLHKKQVISFLRTGRWPEKAGRRM